MSEYFLAAPPSEETFMAELRDHPGDVATLLAWSDWYEERGELKEAQVLRFLLDPWKPAEHFSLLSEGEREQLRSEEEEDEL